MSAGPPSVLDIIREKRGDCTEHALLFAVLARAAGIPAREAGGWLYMDDNTRAFGGHAWDEVILDGHWVPVDPAWNQMEPDPTHIQFSAGESKIADIQCLSGKLKVRVLKVERK